MLSRENVPATFGIVGVLTILLGIFMAWYGFPKIIDSKIKEGISMEQGTDSYKMWEVTPFALKFKIYIFTVENPEDVQNGANPVVKERGPYIYDLYRKKEKVVIHEETDTITYVLKKTYIFNEKESGCRSDDDYVTVLNAALVGTALTVESMMPSAVGMINDAAPYLFPGVKNIFMKVKVKDLLFNGILLDCSSSNIKMVCTAIRGVAPATIRMHENQRDYLFSMFHHLNGTEEGPYTIGRGMKNTSRGEIYAYKGVPDFIGVWFGPECNMLNGTDSTMFAPMEEPAPLIYSFSADLCRSAYVSYEKTTTTSGLKTFRYSNTERNLDILEENDCFCPRNVYDPAKEDCTPKGTMNLMACMKAPTIYSNPHFYLGDRKLLNYVTGLKPSKELHENFVDLEPMTGTPVRGAKRAQFNLMVKKVPDFDLLDNVTEGLLPMIWLEEGAVLPPNLVQLLKDGHNAIHLVEVIKWLIITLGLVLLVIGFVLFLRQDKRLCFADTRVADFMGPVARNGTRNDDQMSSNISNYEPANMYPALYPQLVNRQVTTKNKQADIFLI